MVNYHSNKLKTHDDTRKIVESVTPDEAEILKQDFYNSLLAAFTIDEIEQQLSKVSLDIEGPG